MQAYCSTGRPTELRCPTPSPHSTPASAPVFSRPCARQLAPRLHQQSRDLSCWAAVAVEADTELNIASDVTKLIGAALSLVTPDMLLGTCR